LNSLGEHIRKRRLDLKLTQKQAAEIIGVTESAIWNWEGNESRPFWRYWGAIRDFLGYDPFPPSSTLAEKLVSVRKLRGLSQKEAARQLGVDPSTLARWERGTGKPSMRLASRVGRLLSGQGDSR
jgi:transcriptional regulator with XRE-family HTH domain